MTKLSENVIEKIKGEHICPRPRWCFLLKTSAFWSMLVVSVLLGSISFSVIMHLAAFGDLDMLGHLKGNPITSAVMLLPYFWLISLFIFALVAYFNWKHTKLGYRFKRRWIFVSSIMLSGFLGSVAYTFGMGKRIDMLMVKSMPFYDQSKHSARKTLWLQPENGLLVGKVIEIDDLENVIFIQDEYGESWNVIRHEIKMYPNMIIRQGKIVKIIGQRVDGNFFVAKEIRACGDCWDDEE